jgi:Na+-transporting methylmalonyl-CoA/oxaloacetate decarboxylase gamma subunit
LIIGALTLFLTLGGFVMILAAATDLASRTGGGGDLPKMIVVFGMITLLTLDILLLRQLSKLISAALSPERRAKEKSPTQPQNTFRLPQPTTARLEPGASVTENTTRFLDNYAPSSMPEPVPVKKTDQ